MKISKELRIKAEKMLEGPIAKAVTILGDKMPVELFKKNNELDHIRKHVSLCKTFLKSSK